MVFAVHCIDSIISIVTESKISRLQLSSEAVQAGFSLPGLENPKTELLTEGLN